MLLTEVAQEPTPAILPAALNKVLFLDLPHELLEPAVTMFRGLVESGIKSQPSHRRTVLTAGMLTMSATTRAVAAVVPQISTALTAGVASSAAYHSPHRLEQSSALQGRKTPADWTVGAELVLFYLAALDIVTGQVPRVAHQPQPAVSLPAPDTSPSAASTVPVG